MEIRIQWQWKRGEEKNQKRDKKGKQESELETWRMMRSSTEEDLSNCCCYSSENIPSYIKSCCSFLSSSVASSCNLLFSSLLFSCIPDLISKVLSSRSSESSLLGLKCGSWELCVWEGWVCGISWAGLLKGLSFLCTCRRWKNPRTKLDMD